MIHEHQVRERAYYIWEDEGRVAGQADAHWLKAEAEFHAAAAPLAVQPVAETKTVSPAKTLKPAVSRAKAKAEKAPAKVAKASAKAPTKTKRGEVAVPAFH